MKGLVGGVAGDEFSYAREGGDRLSNEFEKEGTFCKGRDDVLDCSL